MNTVGDYAFKSVGENVTIYPQAKIIGAEFMEIGSNVIIDDFVMIQARAPLYIGNYVHIAAFSSITGGGACCLEDFSGLAGGVRIVTGSDDFLGNGLTNPTVPAEFRAVRRGRVTIRAHVIIGTNSVVLPDVCIGAGASIGAGSVVRKSLAPWTVYSGNPLKAIRPRPSEKILAAEQALFEKYGRPPRLFRDIQ